MYCQAGLYEMFLISLCIAVFVLMPFTDFWAGFFGCCGFRLILSNDLPGSIIIISVICYLQ